MVTTEANEGGVGSPAVTVIIAAYKYSAVLHFALQSLLLQTFQDWECWVIGDATTDDSDAVVASFGDSRLQWYNLPHNHGNQFGPNNEGLRRARGRYIAFLQQDDLWHARHLEVLVAALEGGAEMAHSVLWMSLPYPPFATLFGLHPGGGFQPMTFFPPACVMIRRTLAERVGPWRDWRSLRVPNDVDYICRLARAARGIAPVPELTVFKFSASNRKDVYQEKPTHEQQALLQRLQTEPEVQYRLLMAGLIGSLNTRNGLDTRIRASSVWRRGRHIQSIRRFKGAGELPLDDDSDESGAPWYDDLIEFMAANPADDLAPLWCRKYLYRNDDLPTDGLFLGDGWHPAEGDPFGEKFRWAEGESSLLISRPSGQPLLITLRLESGPSQDYGTLDMQAVDERGQVLKTFTITSEAIVSLLTEPAPARWYTVRLVPQNLRHAPLLHSHDSRELHYRVLGLHIGPVPAQGMSEQAAWWRLDPAFSASPVTIGTRLRWRLRGIVRRMVRSARRMVSRSPRTAL